MVLQALVAVKFGAENDPVTVGLPHPELYGALLSGRTEIARLR